MFSLWRATRAGLSSLPLDHNLVLRSISTHYRILEVAPTATLDEIKAAFRNVCSNQGFHAVLLLFLFIVAFSDPRLLKLS